MARPGTVTVEGARIIFRNFSGQEGMYNREGDRNFAVVLDNEMAEKLKADGWNVKYLKPRDLNEKGESEEEPTPYLSVAVSYKNRPPTAVLIGSRSRTALDESTISILDQVDIETVDLVISPYTWTVSGNTGIKAYLQSIYVVIFEDDLARKWDNALEVSTVNGPAMVGMNGDTMKVESVRGDMKELEGR